MTASTQWFGELIVRTGSALTIDAITEADLPAICAIETRAHSLPWKQAHFVDSIRTGHHHCLGVRSGEQWVGYAIVSCVAGEAELLLLVVDVPWQGCGLATALLNHVFARLQGQADTLFLEVQMSNDRAISLYESLEFNQVGIRPGYYQTARGTEDALIFARMIE